MKRTIVTTVAVCGALALVSGAVLAKSADPAERIRFTELDRDGDGQITREEMMAQRSAHLERADTNGDGLLSVAEIEAMAFERAKRRAERMVERLDANGDGMISMDELRTNARFYKRFDRIDRDSNGTISEDEFEQARARMSKHNRSE